MKRLSSSSDLVLVSFAWLDFKPSQALRERLIMKKGPEGYAFWMNVIMNIILGLLITLAINIAISLQVGMNVITAESVVTTWFSSFVIGVTAGTIADPMSWALKLAGAIKAKQICGMDHSIDHPWFVFWHNYPLRKHAH